jgi:hypothetical protein
MEKLRRLVPPKLEGGPVEEVIDRSLKTVEDFDARITELENGLVAFSERVAAHHEKGEEPDMQLFDQAMSEQVKAMQAQIEALKVQRHELSESMTPKKAA